MRAVPYVRWFSKISSRMAGKEEIENFDLEDFKKIFNHTLEDDPYMYSGNYSILTQHVDSVQQYIKHKIDLDKYIYDFGIYDVEDGSTEKEALVMWIDPETGFMVGKETINNSDATLAQVSTLVKQPSSEVKEHYDEDNPHHLKNRLCYDINPDRVSELQKYLSHHVEPGKYIYQFGIF